ncbi:hypothetical protein HMPREF9296_1340 [Prevotella disiens FB035-09AN]|uniref:Modification methylase n=2 Tax=Prevotella disiens TaxID=28130 RepID=E1KQC8_9BACT|nr:hypothetical protein HMPREF9296_1340 [Prevotella disiens FB035-09AN]
MRPRSFVFGCSSFLLSTQHSFKVNFTMANKTLTLAKKAKNDEFYTQLGDIERELKHYKEHFKGKTVLCNCDDPRVSNFFKYFALNFEPLGLKRVIATCYKNKEPNLFSQNQSEQAVYIVYEGDKNGNRIIDDAEIDVKPLKGDGDFRSKECIELLKQADIVVTNPPFSLFREYVAQLVEYEKKFVIIGNQNAITYKEVFPYLMKNKIWIGYGFGDMGFKVPDYFEPKATRFWIDDTGQKWRSLGNICWFTNLDIQKRHEELILYKRYSPEEYPKYDNYGAINVNKVKEIPSDYDGVMGVPITFMDKYNPKQFEIIGMAEDNGRGYSGVESKWDGINPHCVINGRNKYKRIFIKRKQ